MRSFLVVWPCGLVWTFRSARCRPPESEAWGQPVLENLGDGCTTGGAVAKPFVLFAQRYERGSAATAAAIDRLVHHSVILELNLPSYRLEKSKEQRATQRSKAKPEL